MARGDPPDLPSLKHPDWLSELAAALARGGHPELVPVITNQFIRQVLAEAEMRTNTPVRLAPAGLSEAEQYEHYKRILEIRGFPLDPYSPTVVSIRGMSSDGNLHDTTSARAYDDTHVILTRDPVTGEPHVRVLPGSTHPGQKTADVGGSVGVPDVTGDEKADVGMIEPGQYTLTPSGDHNGAAAWDVGTMDGSRDLPGVRDTNQDGSFSAEERAASEDRNDTLDGVMIHQGADDHPQSAGCLNASSDPDVYGEFIDAMGGEDVSGTLVVLDANQW